MEPKKVEIGLSYRDDGFWLHFGNEIDQQSAIVSLDLIAKERGPIVRQTLMKWADEQMK